MNANKVQTYILKNASATNLLTALDLLRNGQALTSGQSGTVAIAAGVFGAGNTLIESQPWRVVWDGTNYVMFLFVTTG